MAAAPVPLSLDEFLTLPEEKPALEYVDGVVSQKVSPKGPHSLLQPELVQLFDRYARPHKLGRGFTELRATYGGVSTVPDVSYYQTERIPRDPNGRVKNDFIEPPDVAVEIASPDQSATSLVRRCIWYVNHGVRVALLVDPDDESVLSFRPNQIPRVLRDSDRIELDDVIPGFELNVVDLFAVLRID
jgi:Uma2 family endonuclease